MLFRHQKHISAIGYLPQSRDYPKIFSFPAKPFVKLASIAKNAIFHFAPKSSYSKISYPKQKRKSFCAGGDSNPQALRHTHLKRARIPVPPPARNFIIQELLLSV